MLSAISIDAPRTPHQDLRFAAQGLTEMGVRGLASGTNDPYTAVAAIDALSSALLTLCTRPKPDGRFADSEGKVRVLCDWPTSSEVVADVMLALRTYGPQHPLVVDATIRFLSRLEKVASGEVRRVLHDETDALRLAYLRTDPASIDSLPTLAALDSVRLRLRSGVHPAGAEGGATQAS